MSHARVRFTVRRAEAADGPGLWALNRLPNVGDTADASVPLDLLRPDGPPGAFPDLADVVASFISVGGEFLVAETQRHLVGMAGFKPTRTGAHVLRVRVHPAMRRCGIGAALMQELERGPAGSGIGRMHLDTADNQPDAIAFYRALGYTEVGRKTRPQWPCTLVYFEKTTTATC